MIDLHCHVLPGVDDGSLDVADSVAMARQAAADGIEQICATPHIRHDHDVRMYELAERVRELNDALEGEGVPVRILTGGEVAETVLHHITDDELRQVSLGGGAGWILLEPAPGPIGERLLESVAHLKERGYGSVVAHPERHASGDFRERLEALAQAGGLIQVTAAFLEAGPGADVMLDLARHGLVHLVASDAHSSHGGRRVAISGAMARLAEIDVLRPHIGWIAREGPLAVVRGEQATPPFGPL